MTHKFNLKPLLKAGVFALVVGGIFAALAKFGSGKKGIVKPDGESSREKDTSPRSTDHDQEHTDPGTHERSPLSLTPDPTPLKTHWHRKYK